MGRVAAGGGAGGLAADGGGAGLAAEGGAGAAAGGFGAGFAAGGAPSCFFFSSGAGAWASIIADSPDCGACAVKGDAIPDKIVLAISKRCNVFIVESPLEKMLVAPAPGPSRVRTQSNASRQVWFHPRLSLQRRSRRRASEGRRPPGLCRHVAGLVPRAIGMAPLSMMALRPAGVKMKSMNANAALVTVASR